MDVVTRAEPPQSISIGGYKVYVCKEDLSGTFIDFPLPSSVSHFRVRYGNKLSIDEGKKQALFVVNSCEGDYALVKNYFGGIDPPTVGAPGLALPFIIDLESSTCGAWHGPCAGTELHCGVMAQADLPAGVVRPDDIVAGLVLAEVTEVFEATTGTWDCGSTNGEALSQAIAFDGHPDIAPVFSSVGLWLDSGRPDCISDNSASDKAAIQNGGGVLFLHYLRYQLRFDWPSIVAAGRSNLADTYHQLTGSSGAFNRFSEVLNAWFPPSGPFPTNVDPIPHNPFPLDRQSGPLVHSRLGAAGTLQVVLPSYPTGMAIWSQDARTPDSPWTSSAAFGQAIGQIDYACMIQSNKGNPGNMEVIAQQGRDLYYLTYYLTADPSKWSWSAPVKIAQGFCGQPALIQQRLSGVGTRGDFVLQIANPDGGRYGSKSFVRMTLNNDNPMALWVGGPETTAPSYLDPLGLIDSVAIAQTNVGQEGSLAVIYRSGQVLMFTIVDAQGQHYQPPVVVAEDACGTPAIIQGTYGHRGNFEVITPVLSGGMRHHWRDNDSPRFPWEGGAAFSAGSIRTVGLIQSNIGYPGKLVVAAIGDDGLALWERDSKWPFDWSLKTGIPLGPDWG